MATVTCGVLKVVMLERTQGPTHTINVSGEWGSPTARFYLRLDDKCVQCYYNRFSGQFPARAEA